MKLYKTYFHTIANVSEVSEGCNVSIDDILSCEAKSAPQSTSLENQRDLLKIIAVLVSTGKNRNKDVFLAEEVLPARNTGAHKPLNIEHDPKQIVGHMLRTYAALKDGSIVPDDDVPSSRDFDIIAESVLYKFLFPELAESVMSKAKAGKLFVSIEAWFTDYDYLVGTKIVRRTEETASILDSQLSINGGPGSYEGYELGRVLRNIIIGGVGLVKVPANPASIIKSVGSLKAEDVSNIENPSLCKNVVGDMFELSTASLQRSEEVMKRKVLDEIAQVIAAQRAAAEAVESEETGMGKDNPEMTKLVARISALETSNREMKTLLEANEREAEVIRRAEALLAVGLDEKALENRASFMFFMDKDTFDKYVALLRTQLDSITGKVTAALAIERAEATKAQEGGEKAEAEQKVEVAEVKNEETPAKEPEKAAPPTEPVKTEEPKKEPEKQPEVKPEAKQEVKEEPKQTPPEPVKPEAKEPVKEPEKKVEQPKEEPKVEAPKVETPKVEPKVEPKAEPKVEPKKEEPATVNLDNIEPVDQKLNLETQRDSGQPSLTDRMADVVQRFLKDRNKKWENLALKK